MVPIGVRRCLEVTHVMPVQVISGVHTDDLKIRGAAGMRSRKPKKTR
jgi:hypothetical protein